MVAHKAQFRVYYEDTDAGGIVYHARYLGFAERGRAEALRELGMSVGDMVQHKKISFVVRRLEIEYVSPLRLDELLEVETTLVKKSGVRLVLKQCLYNLSRDRQLATIVEVELACLEVSRGIPVRIPSRYCELLNQLQA